MIKIGFSLSQVSQLTKSQEKTQLPVHIKISLLDSYEKVELDHNLGR